MDAILNAAAPNGRGGTYTRADYFAELGQSARDGLGAKAAMVGFLLGEAVKADLGPYAHALDAFLADLEPDGIADGHVNLLDTYGAAPAAVAGATINFDHGQSVSPTATDPLLRSTAGDDAISGANGLDPGQSVSGGAGADRITVAGSTSGTLAGGDGRDVITVDELTGPVSSVATLGHPSVTTAGVVDGGAGDDRFSIGKLATGASIDGGQGDDTLAVRSSGGTIYGQPQSPTLTSVEHLVLDEPDDMPPPITGPGQTPGMPAIIGIDLSNATGLLDITSASLGVGGFSITAAPAAATLIDRGGSAPLRVAFRSGVVDADLHLDGTISGENDNAYLNVHDDLIANVSGTLRVHVDSDSTLRFLDTSTANVTVDGLGRLNARLDQNNGSAPTPTFTVDASASAGVDLGYAVVASTAKFILSSAADTLNLALPQPGVFTATLGGGADTLTLTSLANLNIANNTTVTGYATVTDFQKGVDHLFLPSDATALPKVSVMGSANLEAALIAVSPHVAAGAYALFEFGGDTWVYHQDSTVGANTGDGLIRLVGVTGASVVTGAATGDIHFG